MKGSMKPRTILVVDDDESLRRVTQLQLEEAGYRVLTTSNGAEAMSVVEEETPALVITDLKMPGLLGLDLLNKIRQSHPQTTVLMITAFGTVQTAVEAMKAGAYDYITKPIDYEELVGCVAKTILPAKPNRSPISPGSSVQYFSPRVSWMNWICPRTSPFGNHFTWPFRIMCSAS